MAIMRVLGDKGAIHVRSQLLDSPTLYSLTLALLELHEQTKCWCIVNDRVDVALACGIDALRIAEVQPSGKSRMSVHDWIRGRGTATGDIYGGGTREAGSGTRKARDGKRGGSS